MECVCVYIYIYIYTHTHKMWFAIFIDKESSISVIDQL